MKKFEYNGNSKSASGTKFSIIIPCRAINDFMRESIPYLQKMNYENFEVLISLDKKEDYDFGDDTRFTIFEDGGVSPGEKRNLGAKKATGDVLVFMDDDAYPGDSWLSYAAEIFEDKGVYALGAPAVTPRDASFLEQCSGKIFESFMASFSYVYRYKAQKAREIDDYPSVNLFVRRAAFLAVGGFDINFWPGEDTKLCLDLVRNEGKNFLYDPRPLVYHHRRNVFVPHLKQVSRYGKHRGHYAKIFPETSRLPGYFIPSLFVLGLFFGPLSFLLFPSAYFLKTVYFGVLSFYAVLLLAESFMMLFEEKNIKMALYVGVGIFLTHIVYGYNFLIGFLKRPKLILKPVDKVTGNYSSG